MSFPNDRHLSPIPGCRKLSLSRNGSRTQLNGRAAAAASVSASSFPRNNYWAQSSHLFSFVSFAIPSSHYRLCPSYSNNEGHNVKAAPCSSSELFCMCRRGRWSRFLTLDFKTITKLYFPCASVIVDVMSTWSMVGRFPFFLFLVKACPNT